MLDLRLCLAFLTAAAVGCADDPPKTATFVEPMYEDQCLGFDCGGQGACVPGDSTTGPSCECQEGFAGDHCESCDYGYHRDFEARCVPDKRCADQSSDPCGSHGECRDDAGVISCACTTGYEGPRCQLCAPGYGSDDAGECLQKVLSNAASGTLTAQCDAMTCRNHGQCNNQDGILSCDCYPGYVGPNCDLCDAGYERPAGLDQCIRTASCDAACGGCAMFDGSEEFPDHPDVCNSVRELQTDGVTLWSLGGDGNTWLCSTSSRYDMPTEHVALELGAFQPAEFTFDVPVVRVSFSYVPWDDAPIEVVGDGESATSFMGVRYVRGSVQVEFSEPVSVVGLRSQDEYSHTIAIDDVVYGVDPSVCK
jgi:hypothetical protein